MNSPSPIEGGDQKPGHYTYHPACLLFPQLGKAELQELADDIKANGLRNPIVLYKGQILDGRNRSCACEIAGVEPRFVEWDGTGSPVEWVISENLSPPTPHQQPACRHRPRPAAAAGSRCEGTATGRGTLSKKVC